MTALGVENPSPRWATPRVVLVVAAAIILGHAVLAWLGRLPGVSYSNDDAVYLILADALRNGTYRDLYLVSAPWHTQYPPGWPALLAITGTFTGGSISASFGLAVLLSSLGLAAFFAGARRILPDPLALVALAAAAWSIAVLIPAGRLMSEAAFFGLSMVALWALATPELPRRRVVLVLLVALAAAYVRTIGLALLVAVVVVWLLARHWRRAGVAAGAFLIGFGPWLLWTFFGPQRTVGRSYMRDLSAQLHEVGQSGNPFFGLIGRAAGRAMGLLSGDVSSVLPFLRIRESPIDNILWGVVLLVCGAWGLVILWRRWRVVPLYLVGYFGLLALWTWSTRRFLFPIQPLLWLVLLTGAWTVWQRFGRVAGVGFLAVLLIPIPIQGWPRVVEHVRAGIDCDRARQYESPSCFTPEQLAFFAAARYAKESLPRGAVVLVDREAAFAWHSGHQVVHSFSIRPGSGVSATTALERSGVSHVLLAELTRSDRLRMPRFLKAACSDLVPVRSFSPGTVLFRLASAEGTSCSLLDTMIAATAAEAVGAGVPANGQFQ